MKRGGKEDSAEGKIHTGETKIRKTINERKGAAREEKQKKEWFIGKKKKTWGTLGRKMTVTSTL